MPYVSSSGKMFHVDGPVGRRKLEQKAKPLLLGCAVLLCFLAVVRQGTAAAATIVAPAAIKASRHEHGRGGTKWVPTTQANESVAAAAPPREDASAAHARDARPVEMVEDDPVLLNSSNAEDENSTDKGSASMHVAFSSTVDDGTPTQGASR